MIKFEELNKNKVIKNKLETKFQVFQEDCKFYERQLDNIRDMNNNLRYKLKMTLKNFPHLLSSTTSKSPI